MKPENYDKAFVTEHVLIAEQKLGRRLNKGECVHHVDGNKLNNSPDNLIVFASKKDHSSFHKGAEIHQDGDIWKAKPIIKRSTCAFCGNDFVVKKGTKIHDKSFCSRECFHNYYKKIMKPVAAIIEELKNTNGNFSEVGRINGVTSNAIVRMLKSHNFPFHRKDYIKTQ